MASSYPAPVSALQVGSYFVQQYYQVLQQQPDYVHQFYTETSTMIRIDGESSQTATAVLQTHTLIMSLHYTGIEIKTINSLESWSGGILVVVSGTVKSKDFNGWRNFVETFLLAPQEKGYFVLNDIFHFVSEEVVQQHQTPTLGKTESIMNQLFLVLFLTRQIRKSLWCVSLVYQQVKNELSFFTFLIASFKMAVHNYSLEAEASEHLNSVHIEGDDQVDEYEHVNQYDHANEYAYQEQQEEEEYLVNDYVEEEAPSADPSTMLQSTVEAEQEPLPAVEEPIEEPQKFTYASIVLVHAVHDGRFGSCFAVQVRDIGIIFQLRASKGKSAPSVATKSFVSKSIPPASEWHQPPQPTVQPSNPALSYLPDSSLEVSEEALSQREGESKSVYVRNLPSTVSTLDILQEFKNFGTIKHDGVFLRNRKDIGVCYAFVEFEDVESVQNAIKASPIQLVGRQVYIEERRANSSNTLRGGIGIMTDDREEAEEVTHMRLQEGVSAGVLPEGEPIKMAVTATG
ncbi:hypothetical protein RJ640_029147 [Escallonia rubra]|uniref:G3BP-like protein n=1 Tax=Escallonia rubra TaxID=112253 RepID=A0AA88QVB3_9ASTE|nr:hypothetical protein RJ640_029147 [Escallonia rubra]